MRARRSVSTGEGEGSTGQQLEGFGVEPGKCASLTLHPPASFYTLQQDSDSVPSWVPF